MHSASHIPDSASTSMSRFAVHLKDCEECHNFKHYPRRGSSTFQSWVEFQRPAFKKTYKQTPASSFAHGEQQSHLSQPFPLPQVNVRPTQQSHPPIHPPPPRPASTLSPPPTLHQQSAPFQDDTKNVPSKPSKRHNPSLSPKARHTPLLRRRPSRSLLIRKSTRRCLLAGNSFPALQGMVRRRASCGRSRA